MNNFVLIFLCSIRIISMLVTSPVFSMRNIPSMVKIGLSFMIGILISGSVTAKGALPATTSAIIMSGVIEFLVGASIGVVSSLIFSSVRVSAQLMDFSIGFSMAQYYDPQTSGNSTPLERFFNWYAIVLFFVLNFHYVIIAAVIRSFDVVPVGATSININSFQYIFECFSKSFLIAVELAAPILIVIFIADLTIGLISRAVPQLNIFMLSMPLKILVGLLVISAIVPGITRIYIKAFESMTSNLEQLFKLLPFTLLLGTDDKTEEPSQKKLDDARKKGQVSKSIDMNSAVVLLAATIILSFSSSGFFTDGKKMIVEFIGFMQKQNITSENIMNITTIAVRYFVVAMAPIALTIMFVGIIANIAQTGFIKTSESLKPDLKKINPLEGFKRIFSKRTLLELIKSILKIVVIGYVAYGFIKSNIMEILKTSDMNPVNLYPFTKNIAQSQLVRVVMVMLVIGIIDYVVQKRQYKKDMMMTKEEVKEEYKESEGNPETKSRIKQKQKEFATRRMMSEVPKATVVVTNPTHLAIAIKYEKEGGKPPYVIAKGADLVAQKIKEIARNNDVPIVENKPLARAMYAKVEIDEEVPVELYQAVAEIIAYVYSIKKM